MREAQIPLTQEGVPSVGPYELLMRLDAGDPSPLFLGRPVDSPEETVMIRTQPRSEDLGRSRHWKDRFEARGLLARRLAHPCILPVVESGLQNDRPYVVYAPSFGIGLVHLIKHQVRIPLRVLARFGVGAIDALQYLTEIDVLPQAITPERFMITYDGRMLWVDCGLEELSLIYPSEAQRLAYLPPGPIDTKTEASRAYGLGKLLAQLILISCSVEEAKLDPGSMPILLRDAVRQLTHKDPQSRSLEVARRALVDFGNEEGRPSEQELRFLINRCRRQYSLLCTVLTDDIRPVAGPMSRGESQVAGGASVVPVQGFRLDRVVGGLAQMPLWEGEGPRGAVWVKTRTEAPSEKFDLEDMQEHLQRELDLVKLLDSDALPQIEQHDLTCSTPYVAYAWEASTDLMRTIGRFDAERVATIGFWLADALSEMHERGVIFGNLQPRAIRLRPDGRPLLFDLTYLNHRNRLATGLSDNHLALAPETLADGVYDEASERFALGGLLYQLVCGTRPFRALEARELEKQLRERNPTPLSSLVPQISPAWERLIMGLLDKHPMARPSLKQVLDLFGPDTTDLYAVPAGSTRAAGPTPFGYFDEVSEVSTTGG